MEKEYVEVLLEEIRGQLQLLAEGHMATQAALADVNSRIDKVDAKMDRRFDRVESELHLIRDGIADHEGRITKLEKRRR